MLCKWPEQQLVIAVQRRKGATVKPLTQGLQSSNIHRRADTPASVPNPLYSLINPHGCAHPVRMPVWACQHSQIEPRADRAVMVIWTPASHITDIIKFDLIQERGHRGSDDNSVCHFEVLFFLLTPSFLLLDMQKQDPEPAQSPGCFILHMLKGLNDKKGKRYHHVATLRHQKHVLDTNHTFWKSNLNADYFDVWFYLPCFLKTCI